MLLDFKLFIQGQEVPISESFSLSFNLQALSSLSFALPVKSFPYNILSNLPRSIVSLFFSFDKKNYYLLYEGEITFASYNFLPQARLIQLTAIDFFNILNNINIHFVDLTRPVIKEHQVNIEIVRVAPEFMPLTEWVSSNFINLDKDKRILKNLFFYVLNRNVAFYSDRIKRLKLQNKTLEIISKDVLEWFNEAKKEEKFLTYITNAVSWYPNTLSILQFFGHLISNYLFSNYFAFFKKATDEKYYNFFLIPDEPFLPIPISNVIFADLQEIIRFSISQSTLPPTRIYINIQTEIADKIETIIAPIQSKFEELKKEIQSTEKETIHKKIDDFLTEEEKRIGIISLYDEIPSNSILYLLLRQKAIKLATMKLKRQKINRRFEIVLSFSPQIVPGFPIFIVGNDFKFIGRITNIIHNILFTGNATTTIVGDYCLFDEEINSYEEIFKVEKDDLSLFYPVIGIGSFKSQVDNNNILSIDKIEQIKQMRQGFKIENHFLSFNEYLNYYNLKLTELEGTNLLKLDAEEESPFFQKKEITQLIEKYLIRYIKK